MKVEAIYLRSDKTSPPTKVSNATATAGLGLEGDHFKKKDGKRQITLLSQESWLDVCSELGAELDPSIRRANVLISGVDFTNPEGKYLKIGRVLVDIQGETHPCRLMDEAHPGLWDALKPHCRGGVYGQVVAGGSIHVGDKVMWSTGL